jgi:hypothetical protein
MTAPPSAAAAAVPGASPATAGTKAAGPSKAAAAAGPAARDAAHCTGRHGAWCGRAARQAGRARAGAHAARIAVPRLPTEELISATVFAGEQGLGRATGRVGGTSMDRPARPPSPAPQPTFAQGQHLGSAYRPLRASWSARHPRGGPGGRGGPRRRGARSGVGAPRRAVSAWKGGFQQKWVSGIGGSAIGAPVLRSWGLFSGSRRMTPRAAAPRRPRGGGIWGGGQRERPGGGAGGPRGPRRALICQPAKTRG